MRMRWLRSAAGHQPFDVLDGLPRGELDSLTESLARRHLARCEVCRWRLAWVRRLPIALEAGTRAPRVPDAERVLRRRREGQRVILPI